MNIFINELALFEMGGWWEVFDIGTVNIDMGIWGYLSKDEKGKSRMRPDQ